MHDLQKKILRLAQANQLNNKNLRGIADSVGIDHLQKVKHHLAALVNKNFLYRDINGDYQMTEDSPPKVDDKFVRLPIYGFANCGAASLYTRDNIEGYMPVAKSLLPRLKPDKLIILKAVGDSMNQADINGDSIKHGDYLIVDTTQRSPRDGDYILAIIDNMACIKKYTLDRDRREIRLISESTANIPPIITKENDDFLVNGRVIKVVKKVVK